jgi:RNase P subunit RPR2
MKSELTRPEIEKHLKEVFSKQSSVKEIKKAKKLAMSKRIKLGELKKKFCKKCYSIFNSNNSEVRVKKGFLVIRCKECKYVSRHKLKKI